MSALLALVAAFGWGASDFAGGIGSRKSTADSVVVLTHLVATLALLAFARGSFGSSDLIFGLAAGVSGGLGALMLYRGLAKGTMAVVAPITAAGAATIPTVWGMLHGDAWTVASLAGVLLALGAIVLISWTSDGSSVYAGAAGTFAFVRPLPRPGAGHDGEAGLGDRLAALESNLRAFRSFIEAGPAPQRRFSFAQLSRPGVSDALLSGLGFGGFYILVNETSESAGLWPMVAARAVSVVMFATGAVMRSSAVLPARGSWIAVVIAGLFDALAAVTFLAATRSGQLSIVAMLSSLYPAVTVLLARVTFKEVLVRRQVLGLGLAGGAVVLFSIA